MNNGAPLTLQTCGKTLKEKKYEEKETRRDKMRPKAKSNKCIETLEKP